MDLWCAACLWDKRWRKADVITSSKSLCYEHAIGADSNDAEEANAILTELTASKATRG